MKHFLLLFIFLASLNLTSALEAMSNTPKTLGGDDPGPFPMALCEFPINNIYGVWSIHDSDDQPLYLIQIKSLKRSTNPRNIEVTQYAYSDDYRKTLSKPIAKGYGVLSKNKMEFIAQMTTISDEFEDFNYELYFRHFCDHKGRKKYEIYDSSPYKPKKDTAGDIMIRQKSFKSKD